MSIHSAGSLELHRLLNKSVGFLLCAILPVSVIIVRAQAIRTRISPDGTLRARIVPVGKEGRESRIEIRDIKNQSILTTRSFASSDGEHGESVAHAVWSPNSRFFVFNTYSSGGHQPWHSPTYFYSVRDNVIRKLDDYIGPITADFQLRPPDVIKTRTLVPGEGLDVDGGPNTAVKLSRIARRRR